MVCVPSRGHVAVWRIKLAAVVYRLSPPRSICSARPHTLQLCSQALLQTHNPPTYPTLPNPLQIPVPIPMYTHTHTHRALNSCNIHQQPSHDTIYSVQPLLPRVLWLSSMQISHVLIVVIYLFFLWKREEKGGEEFPPEIDSMTEQKKRDSAPLWAELPSSVHVWHFVMLVESLF